MFKKYLKEAQKKSDYEIYHDSYTSATQTAIDFAIRNGYLTDDEETFKKIGTGPAKPGRGKTNRIDIKLYKGEVGDLKKTKRVLHFQVYNRETNKNTYELNAYIG